MSVKSFAEGAYKFIRNSFDDFQKRGIAGKAGKGLYNKIIKPVGHMAEDTVLKVGANTLEGTAKTVDHFRRNGDKYKKVGKGLLGFTEDTAFEAARGVGIMGQAGLNVLSGIEKMGLVERAPLSTSLIGWKATRRGKLALAAGALAIGAGTATKDYTESRVGRNDGQLYRPTPTMTSPYELANQMAYSQGGQSFANNAGATGDLVFALDNLNK